MFGISLLELAVIFIVGLLVLGPEKLPEAARKLGKITADLRKASDSIRREFYNSVYKPVGDLEAKIKLESRQLISDKIAESTTNSTKNGSNTNEATKS